MKTLSDCELQTLRIIWNCNANNIHPALKDVMNGYNEKYRKDMSPLAPQTISTFLKRLVNKGYLSSYRKGRYTHYEAVVSPGDYRNLYLPDMLELLYGDKAEMAMAALQDIF